MAKKWSDESHDLVESTQIIIIGEVISTVPDE